MFEQNEFREMMYALRSVRHAHLWTRELGLEYWMQPGLAAMGVGAFSDGVFAVTGNGWVNTGTIIGVAGSGADFLDATDKGSPCVFAIDTAGDLLNSPALFGDYTHGIAAAESAGVKDLPSKLVYDSWGTNFAVVSGSETASGHGFVEDGGAASVANDHLACFTVPDGVSFKLRSGAATSAALMAADTNPHHWRIVIDRIAALAYAYIDNMNTPLGSIAIEGDEFPCSVGAGVLASTGTNMINWGPTRVRYVWAGWGI